MILKVALLNVHASNDENGIKFDYASSLFEDLFHNNNIILENYQIQFDEFPPLYVPYDAYLISGSKHSIHDPFPWIKNLKRFITQLENKKIIGVCFGHQLLADIYGGTVGRNTTGWHTGVDTTHIIQTPPWMTPHISEVHSIFHHQECVTQLPNNSNLIAGSQLSPYDMYTIDDKIFSMQFHPEFTVPHHSRLLKKIQHQLPPDQLQEAISSHQQVLDNDIIASWIVNFIKE